MVSLSEVAHQQEKPQKEYELWLFAAGNRFEPLSLCGRFDSEERAQQMAAAVRQWFNGGDWDEEVLMRLPPEGSVDIEFMRVGFEADGVDLSEIRIEARECGAPYLGDNRYSQTERGWLLPMYPHLAEGTGREDGSLDDTELEPTEMLKPHVVFRTLEVEGALRSQLTVTFPAVVSEGHRASLDRVVQTLWSLVQTDALMQQLREGR